MYIHYILKCFKEKNQIVESKLNEPICLSDCIDILDVSFQGKTITLEVNFYTLDILNRKDISRELIHALFTAIEDTELIRNSKRVERRTFCDFLKLKYINSSNEIYFLDRDSPDFILYEGDHQNAYEVVEATNSIEAQFNTMCRHTTGRKKTKEEYKDYASNKHKENGNNFHIYNFNGDIILSPFKGLVDTYRTRKQVVEAILKKVKKYKEYKATCDEKNIVVMFSSSGYSNESDFKNVGEMISLIDDIRDSDIDRIFVVSGLYKTLVEYNKMGMLLEFSVDSSV